MPFRNDLYFAAAIGPVAHELSSIRIQMGKGKAAEVFATKMPIIDNQVTGHYRRIDEAIEFRTRSMICVPLSQGNRIYGVMQMLNKAAGEQPYTQSDLELITRFASQATIAIRNAQLFEQLLSSSGLYAAPDVRRELVPLLLDPTGPQLRERLTVMFADMRSFTRLASSIVRRKSSGESWVTIWG